MIRIMDSTGYHPMFTVESGAIIRITFTDGEFIQREVKDIDYTHFYFGTAIYHVAQFGQAFGGAKIEKI